MAETNSDKTGESVKPSDSNLPLQESTKTGQPTEPIREPAIKSEAQSTAGNISVTISPPPAHIDLIEQVGSGDLSLSGALRKWLNEHPMKRGRYILVILTLCAVVAGGYKLTSYQKDDLKRERDKWFLAYQPFAAASQQLTNIEMDKRMTAVLEIVTNGIAKQLVMAGQIDAIYNALKAAETQNQAALLTDFPDGYAYFTFIKNEALVPVVAESGLQVDWKNIRVEISQGALSVYLPKISSDKGGLVMFQNALVVPARNGGETTVHINPSERNNVVGNIFGKPDRNSEIDFSNNPTETLVVRSVIVQGVGNAVLFGLRPYRKAGK